LRALGSELIQFFALMLWVAAGLAFALGTPELGVAIILVVVINALFSFYQEYRAERATNALFLLLPQQTWSFAMGSGLRSLSRKLVPGDVLLLREGSRISCDARVVSSGGLHVDNSILTGESKPVARGAEAPETDDLMSAQNVVFAGTFVTSGFGAAVVVATGEATQLAGISRLTGAVVRRPTPLRIDLHRTVRVIAACAFGMGLAFFALSFLLGGSAKSGLLFAVGVIVALVPNGLLPTVTTSLAISAKRMARRRVLVRHLESIETLGATTVICSDKTGTMTANQMNVQAVAGLQVYGETARSLGSRLQHPRSHTQGRSPALAGRTGATRNALENGGPLRKCNRGTTRGQLALLRRSKDGALVAFAVKGGCPRESAERAEPRVHEFAFDTTRRRISTVHQTSSGGFEILV
jgi:magnesium-transporting ATPase (P-type)